MIDLNITTQGVDKLALFAAKLRGDLPFAQSVAINATAFEVRKQLNQDTTQHLDNPVPFTKRAFLVEKGNKRDLTARVGLSDRHSYLIPQIIGGRRGYKSYEGLIKGLADGAISRPAQLVPEEGILNRYGNPRRSIFQDLEGKIDTGKGGIFIGKPLGKSKRNKVREFGVWQRPKNKKGQLVPLFYVTNTKAQYQPELPMERTAATTISEAFPRQMRQALLKVLS